MEANCAANAVYGFWSYGAATALIGTADIARGSDQCPLFIEIF